MGFDLNKHLTKAQGAFNTLNGPQDARDLLEQSKTSIETAMEKITSPKELKLLQTTQARMDRNTDKILNDIEQNMARLKGRDEILQQEMNSWVYPLHFIDFETSTVPLPFHPVLRPTHKQSTAIIPWNQRDAIN